MRHDKFLVGELAKLFNISSDTLRYYDKIDLVKPEHDQENNYRYYDIRSFFQLSRVLFFKSLDISLDEIRDYMKNKNKHNLLRLLHKKEEELDLKINRLINLKNKIRAKYTLLENVDAELNQVVIKNLPIRNGVYLDVSSETEIKKALKSNEQYLKNSSWLIEGQIYTSVSKHDIENGLFTQFRYFIEILSLEQSSKVPIDIPKEQECACITFVGPYREMTRHYKTLIQWIAENGYDVKGDSIEKNIVDYDFSDSESEFVSEIQIPIAKRL